MKNIISILFAFFFISCHSEPQPLVVGKDECFFCKMPVADIKFGGEIITEKGKFYKFDDIGCLISFLKTHSGADVKVKETFAMNYITTQKLLDVNKSVFLKSANLHSPMNSGIAAFESRTTAEIFLKEFTGEILTWQQLQTKLK